MCPASLCLGPGSRIAHTYRNTHRLLIKAEPYVRSLMMNMRTDRWLDSWLALRWTLCVFSSVCWLCAYPPVCMRRKVSTRASACAATVMTGIATSAIGYGQTLGIFFIQSLTGSRPRTWWSVHQQSQFQLSVTSIFILLKKKHTVLKCWDYHMQSIKTSLHQIAACCTTWVHCWEWTLWQCDCMAAIFRLCNDLFGPLLAAVTETCHCSCAVLHRIRSFLSELHHHIWEIILTNLLNP